MVTVLRHGHQDLNSLVGYDAPVGARGVELHDGTIKKMRTGSQVLVQLENAVILKNKRRVNVKEMDDGLKRVPEVAQY